MIIAEPLGKAGNLDAGLTVCLSVSIYVYIYIYIRSLYIGTPRLHKSHKGHDITLWLLSCASAYNDIVS